MNKEWLADYAAREDAEYQRFLNNFRASESIEYPPKSRFRKISNPMVDSTTNVWTLIPFYGSTLIHVHPCSQETMIEMSGWGTNTDVTNLVQLAKDTGRVQFILDKSPLDYQPFDYLEPILKELNPPVVKLIPNLVFDKDQYKEAENEFGTLSGYKFFPYLQGIFEGLKNSGLNYPSFHDFSFKFKLDYATLKLTGYQEITNRILDLMIDNPELASYYFYLYGTILATSKHDSFHISYDPVFSIDGERLRQITSGMTELSRRSSFEKYPDEELRKHVFPFEVGELLINKLTLGAEGYLGCTSLIDRYEHEDLRKLLSSIQDAIKRKNVDMVRSNTRELSNVLDNLWGDAKISRLSDRITFGIPVMFAAIGSLISQDVGGISGLLAGIGLRALDKKITPLISEKLAAKATHNDQLIAIYEFKKKYNIKN